MTIELFVSNKSYSYSQARRHERMPADFVVHVRDETLRVGDRCSDISEAGIGIETPRPLPLMSLVSLQIDADEKIDVLGRVMWTANHRMGVRFEQADQRVTDLVARLRQNYQRI